MRFLRLLPVMFGIALLSAIYMVFYPSHTEQSPRDQHKIIQQWSAPKKIIR